jgi:hypothetical protein
MYSVVVRYVSQVIFIVQVVFILAELNNEATFALFVFVVHFSASYNVHLVTVCGES